MIEGIFVEGLIYSIMALGVFFTFRILDFPDLTVDGSFPMGAVIMAACLHGGIHPLTGLLLSFCGGLTAGAVTAAIHNKLKVPHLLAGILTMTMLYSVNIRILSNRANLPLLRVETLLTRVHDYTREFIPPEYASLLFFILVVFIIKKLLDLFFITDMGLVFGALGNNEQMVRVQGINPATLKLIGVGLSNGLVALSGAFAAQYQGFADINLGQGIVVTGLASVMLGEFLLKSNKISVLTLRVILGTILFKAIMYLGRYYGYYINMTPNDLKLIAGILIILSLGATNFKGIKKGSRS
ncbi:putative ABC transport system permease protein [Desulfocicer vacuolatum DSM 3385]|uniref:Putative ABC transport system permease protein n=1 Tax=Desulfocicer vacuolatum DSM 3385 TaxID=1121400 RepID=A0A1W1YQQ2_9BACT|nr:ABC transporter permease [Desulfocicer vacuolatum]SMC38038.1 putative ABC transport system permease protein [Desulfocicer vacuolatum DSM 3385]